MSIGPTERLRFGDYELDYPSGKLFRDGLPVRIQPQPLRVLSILLERPGEIVSREELRARIWGDATFVEFDQGLNYCIRHIRVALREGASKPLYIETLPKQGYRFFSSVVAVPNGSGAPITQTAGDSAPQAPPNPRRVAWYAAAAVCAGLAIATAFYRPHAARPATAKYTQLTDFTDSALSPAISPDGHMVAFIRGNSDFLTTDQVYVKVLPNGEARRITDDRRMKYNVAFSPDGSRIAYTVLDSPHWATYTVSVLGGDSHLFLNDAAGLTWLDTHRLLFSRIRSGLHMGIVTGTETRDGFRELYFPAHERGMAHFSYASPDRKSALVVEMNERGGWAPCRLISLTGGSQGRPAGPLGPCLSAGWSPDGAWMYFTAVVAWQSHLWRQRFPDGVPEQLTFGPIEDEGVAVEKDGQSVITASGVEASAIWVHDGAGDRSLSSEGEIITGPATPSFANGDKTLYFLVRHGSADTGPELWRMTVESGKSEAVFPGISIFGYDISPDGKLAVYSAASGEGKPRTLWLAPLDQSSPPKQIGASGEASPCFGPGGKIVFQAAEGSANYLEQMNPDGSARKKAVPYPISSVEGISPGRQWIMATVPHTDGRGASVMAIPLDGGSPRGGSPRGGTPRRVCASACSPKWSSDGKFLFVPVEMASRSGPGRSLAIPAGPGESLPPFPSGGIEPFAGTSVMPGSQSVNRADFVPGKDPSHFVYVNSSVHRNLYRISIP